MLTAAHLACVRGGRDLFANLSFTVPSGTLLRVSGANGAGKTSLLRILCGLLLPSGGEVLWRKAPVRQQCESPLRRKIPRDSEFAQSIASGLAEARQLAGGAVPAGKAQAAKPAVEPVIRGTVRLSPKLAAQVSPDDMLFVFSRAIDGPRVPLAVKRFRAAQLPVEFVLDQSSAMSPDMTLAQHTEVTVGARISKSGSPGPKSVDLEGFRQPVKVGGSASIEIFIDTQRP